MADMAWWRWRSRHRCRWWLNKDGHGLRRGDSKGSGCLDCDVGCRWARRFMHNFSARVPALRGVGCATARFTAVDDAIGNYVLFLLLYFDETHFEEVSTRCALQLVVEVEVVGC
jgi:hypothetical protein